jgi:hypothetical protein
MPETTAAAGHADPPPAGTARPVPAIDVHGIPNPTTGRDPAGRATGRVHHGKDPHGQAHHGARLWEQATLTDTPWGTSRLHLAPARTASLLGMPHRPHAPLTGARFGRPRKLSILATLTAGRPVTVLADDYGGMDSHDAAPHQRRDTPTPLQRVDSRHGPRRPHIDATPRWLAHL